MDGVETTIEKHINEFKPVVHAKRLLNRKNKQKTKKNNKFVFENTT